MLRRQPKPQENEYNVLFYMSNTFLSNQKGNAHTHHTHRDNTTQIYTIDTQTHTYTHTKNKHTHTHRAHRYINTHTRKNKHIYT